MEIAFSGSSDRQRLDTSIRVLEWVLENATISWENFPFDVADLYEVRTAVEDMKCAIRNTEDLDDFCSGRC